MTYTSLRRINIAGGILSVLTMIGAIFWAFPLYWAIITTLKPEQDVVKPGLNLWPQTFTLEAYTHVLFTTKIGIWYTNSLITAGTVTVLVVIMSAAAGYAISQMNFPGRRVLWWLILASFMVPIPALIVNHFVLMSQFKLLNSWAGVILPQLLAPVTVMIYKQFFDSVPKEFREAAIMDGATELQLLAVSRDRIRDSGRSSSFPEASDTGPSMACAPFIW